MYKVSYLSGQDKFLKQMNTFARLLKAIVYISFFCALLLTGSCKRACSDVTCFNSGTCDANTGMCSCAGRWGGEQCDSLCKLGYEGIYCNIASRDKLMRTWNATTTSVVSGKVEHQLVVTAGTGIEKIIISNMNGENYACIGTMTGKDKFDIVSQNAMGEYTGIINGSGQLKGEKLVIDFTKAGAAYFSNCNK
jgi:hypothetical protein